MASSSSPSMVDTSDMLEWRIVPPPKAKSKCWKYFGFKAAANGQIIDKRKMICKICRTEFSYAGNTTNLSQHLSRKHPNVQLEVGKSPVDNNCVYLEELSDFPDQEILTIQTDQSNELDLDVILVSYLAKSLLPVKTVDTAPFISLLKALNPTFAIPSLTTMKSCIIPSVYEKHRQNLSSALHGISTYSLSGHSWATERQNYFTMTIHFIDEQHKLKNRILKTWVVTNTRIKEKYHEAIEDVIDEYSLIKANINAVIHTFVEDDTCDRPVMIEGIVSLPCFDHVLDNITRSTFQVPAVSEMITNLQNYLNLIRYDEGFKDLHNTFCSNPFWKMPNINVLKERWNLIYEAFVQILDGKDVLCDINKQSEDPELRKFKFDESDFDILEDVIAVLKPLHVIISSLCTDDYVSLSLIKPLVCQLINKHCTIHDADSDLIQHLKRLMKSILHKAFIDKSFDRFMDISSFVDPRFKVLGYLDTKSKDLLMMDIQSLMLKNITKNEKQEYSQDQSTNCSKKLKRENDSDISFLLAEVCENDKRISSMSERASQEISAFRVEEPSALDSNPVLWWNMNWHRFPLLYNLAKMYLTLPATCQRTKLLYTKEKGSFELKRSQIEAKYVDIMLFLNCALKE